MFHHHASLTRKIRICALQQLLRFLGFVVTLRTSSVSAWVPSPIQTKPSTFQSTIGVNSGVTNLSTRLKVSLSDDATEVDSLIAVGREEFQQYFSFQLDDWQLQAGGAIARGYNVITTAPTGAGKTVVGEMALLHAFHRSKSSVYTTPLKALSNQKYSDLCQMFGPENTGLSTGDISINKDAKVRVMTTEVYRNIAWRSSTPAASMGTEELHETAVVVLDEFHYMGQPGRGGVWEESVITSPQHTQIISLSATLANGEALASWMESVAGRKTILVEVPGQKRPVPLRYIFATKKGLYPLFRDVDAGPGALHGLLGFRGDGEPPKENKENKRKNRSSRAKDKKGIPKGLTAHPALQASSQARMAKVLRSLERRNRQNSFRNIGNGDSFDIPKKISARQQQREKERLLRNEMRREVPSLGVLLTRLKQKDLLPAIFFIFSRAACDEQAASAYQTMKGPRDPNRLLDEEFEQFDVEPDKGFVRRKSRQRAKKKKAQLLEDLNGRNFRPESNYVSEEVLTSYLDDSAVSVDEGSFDDMSPLAPGNWDYYAKAGLLEYPAVREVASRIEVFNDQNPEIAFDDEIAEQFLFGIGSHHAGMLPAHKSFVEILFRRELMAVVFATETLAAGINMPARTTVICAMAKRSGSGSSMALLETSNMLQMAGRAGRRGFDTEGTCVVVATPFEGHEDAIKILTDPIKPIQSQFTPSYSLAINLVVRGDGKLDVARELVSKSFAAWEKRKAEETIVNKMDKDGENGVSQVLEASAQDRFMSTLVDSLQVQIDRRRAAFDSSKLQYFLDILNNRESLKTTSKAYVSLSKALELEETTLRYLVNEAESLKSTTLGDDDFDPEQINTFMEEDVSDLDRQINEQRERIVAAEKALQKNPFTAIASTAQKIIDGGSPEGEVLREHLRAARPRNTSDKPQSLTGTELTNYAKSALVVARKTRKLSRSNPGIDPETLLLQADILDTIKDSSFIEVLSITKILVAYGCLAIREAPETNDDSDDETSLSDEYYENATYSMTPAGLNVGMMGFENALWVLTAIGGAWDVGGASSNLDSLQQEINDEENKEDDESIALPAAAEEAQKLVSTLCEMEPAEFAGYVSVFVSENNRGGGSFGPELLDQFRVLTASQQRGVQNALLAMDRLKEVQQLYSVNTGCNFDIGSVEVVTEWAAGCSWNDALALSGLPPGDLVRVLSRVLDAVRQLGNLPFEPIRSGEWITGSMVEEHDSIVSPGIHPDIRRLCRQAAKSINRYPVKDPLAFETTEQEDKYDDDDDEDVATVDVEDAD